ncbi:hypothetical protein BDV06DRAFT_228144 [Aspergillus oleicola]
MDEYIEHAVDAVIQAQRHHSILPDKVFVLGHSLGAVVAPKIVSMEELGVTGCILLAPPGEPLYRYYVRQLKYIKSLDGPEALYLGKQIMEAERQAEVAGGFTG